MADGVKIEITGDKELVAALENLHQEAVLLSAQESAMAGAVRMRTRLRRAAPVGQNSRTRIRAGWPRLSESMRAKGGSNAPVAWAGLISRSPWYYRVLDVGRKPFKKRTGKMVAGSPPMNPWWDRAVASASSEVQEVMMRKLVEQLRKRIANVISAYNAPIRFK